MLTEPRPRWLDAVGGGLTYGRYIGLLADVVLGVVNGVALGCVLRVGTKRPQSDGAGVRRYTAMTMVFNAIIVAAVVAHIFGTALFVNTFSIVATGVLLILAAGSAAWVNARVAQSYLRSLYRRFTTA